MTLREKHPELYVSASQIDPGNRTRVVPMEVLCLGYMRTGTASMQAALNILGIPCSHSFSLYGRIRDIPTWIRAFDAKYHGLGPAFTRRDWDSLLGDYGAVTDVPAIAFWDDLLAAYPEAKVVLVERADVARWHASFCAAVVAPIFSVWGNRLADREPRFVGPLRDVHHRWVRDWMRVGSEEEMRRVARDKYSEHYAAVRAAVPRERLLEYELGSGWGPLCAFLGKEVPPEGVEFPRVNETAAMQEKFSIIAWRGLRNVGRKLLLMVLAPLVLGFVIWKMVHG
ncbi:MAG: hypothetical protein LQ344_001640 [Seirophora lacunosa]|nr:MAG: hypothetical protein LQ344_001640 [Seirophora lacunosa]